MPFMELKGLTLNRKLQKILRSVKQDKILFIDGKLPPVEESELIRRTMEEIDRKFKGIEICSVDGYRSEKAWGERIKNYFATTIFGINTGFTVIGPASVIKEIRKDPSKIELLTFDKKKRRR
jgi:hypothetical protein